MATIVGEMKGKELFRRNLSKTKPIVIGRGEEANLRMKIRGISREHTSIEFSDGEWIVKDLGSTNGTLVNGKKISSQILGPDDHIQLGEITLKLVIETQPAKPRLSPGRDRRQRVGRERESSTAGKAVKWAMRLAIWFAVIYCGWGYYEYMTTMKEAIECRNDGIDLHNEGRFGEAIITLEKSRALKKKSRRNLFVKLAHSYLPQKELPLEEDVARSYYERGNKLYNNRDENLDREALADYERAFRLKPDIPGLAKAMFPIAFSQKRWQLTLDAAEEALRQDPNNTMIEKILDIAKKELSAE